MARTVVSDHKVLLFVEAKRGFDDFAQSFPQAGKEIKLSRIAEREARIFIVKKTIVRLVCLQVYYGLLGFAWTLTGVSLLCGEMFLSAVVSLQLFRLLFFHRFNSLTLADVVSC
jgi:hypothetical protein